MADDNILDAKEWTAFAEADLEVAVHLTKTFRPKPLEIICFHCQQASEKAVKSIIALNGRQGGLPKRHDLFLLLNQIKNMTPVEEKFYDYADELASYGVAARYPNELFLEERHAEKAVKMAKEFVEWAKSVVADAEAAN